jgi:hypothetical protein
VPVPGESRLEHAEPTAATPLRAYDQHHDDQPVNTL